MFGYPDSQPLLTRSIVHANNSRSEILSSAGDLPGVPGWLVLIERLGALLALILLIPALALTAAVIFLLSGRSPLIAHARLGQHGKRMWMLKLRTMWQGSVPPRKWRSLFAIERIDGALVPPSKRHADRRVTSGFAVICRRYSIDELPQLWHVVSGEMSLVGPRPITASEFDRWYGQDAADILLSKPGLTGLWQVKGRSALSYSQRRRLDLFLVRRWSVSLYLKVLISTIPRLISGDGAL